MHIHLYLHLQKFNFRFRRDAIRWIMKLSKTVVEMKSHPTKTASSAGIDFELTQEFSGSIHRRACRLPPWPIWAEAGIHLGKKIRPCLLKKISFAKFQFAFQSDKPTRHYSTRFRRAVGQIWENFAFIWLAKWRNQTSVLTRTPNRVRRAGQLAGSDQA